MCVVVDVLILRARIKLMLLSPSTTLYGELQTAAAEGKYQTAVNLPLVRNHSSPKKHAGRWIL